jgi:hypothetical protein
MWTEEHMDKNIHSRLRIHFMHLRDNVAWNDQEVFLFPIPKTLHDSTALIIQRGQWLSISTHHLLKVKGSDIFQLNTRNSVPDKSSEQCLLHVFMYLWLKSSHFTVHCTVIKQHTSVLFSLVIPSPPFVLSLVVHESILHVFCWQLKLILIHL